MDLICVLGKLRDLWMNKPPIKWNASLTAEYDLAKDIVFLCGPGLLLLEIRRGEKGWSIIGFALANFGGGDGGGDVSAWVSDGL